MVVDAAIQRIQPNDVVPVQFVAPAPLAERMTGVCPWNTWNTANVK